MGVALFAQTLATVDACDHYHNGSCGDALLAEGGDAVGLFTPNLVSFANKIRRSMVVVEDESAQIWKNITGGS